MSVSLSLEEGGLIVDSTWTIESVSPEWYPHQPKSDVHHIRLLWMPRFVKPADKSYNELELNSLSFMLVSPSFSLGKNWLKANLIMAKEDTKGTRPNLYLKVLPEHEAQILGKIRVSTIKSLINGNTLAYSWEHNERLITRVNVVNERGWNLKQLDNLWTMESYLTSIRVVIEVVILDETGFGQVHSKLSVDFRDLRMEQNPAGQGTDITLQIGSTQLGAHKFVLSARSPVLKTMLNTDMAEARTGVIELKQMTVKAAQDFIGFIYSGQIDRERLLDTSEELLQVAGMYNMPDLMAICESTLRGIITVNNTAQFLIIASLHNAKLLKADTLSFLARNKSDVIATEEWADAMANHSKILLEAILALV